MTAPSHHLANDETVDAERPERFRSGRGLQSILARLKQSRAQAPSPFRDSDFVPESSTPEWSVLGKL